MRAKLRRQISKLLKELKIPAKLYRGSRFKAFKGCSGTYLRNLLLKLEFSRPGTLVGDCDALNHIVKGFATKRFIFKNWRSAGYVFVFPQLEYEDGTWSCGCETSPEPPMTREQIETYLLQRYLNPSPGWPLSDDQKTLRDTLLRGEHIVDERGVLLNPKLSTKYT